MDRSKIILISVDGNVGAGKTSFLRWLKSNKNHIICEENVDAWRTEYQIDGESLFSLYFKDPKRYAFKFQVMALVKKIELLREVLNTCSNGDIVFFERSLLIDYACFADMHRKNGNMDDIEWKIYTTLYEQINALDIIKPDIMLYLKCSINTAWNRIQKRNREEEYNLNMETIVYYKQQHDKLLKNAIVLDAEPDIIKNTHLFETFYEKVKGICPTTVR